MLNLKITSFVQLFVKASETFCWKRFRLLVVSYEILWMSHESICRNLGLHSSPSKEHCSRTFLLCVYVRVSVCTYNTGHVFLRHMDWNIWSLFPATLFPYIDSLSLYCYSYLLNCSTENIIFWFITKLFLFTTIFVFIFH